VLARHANARVTGMFYAGISEQAKAKMAGEADRGWVRHVSDPP
jgi:hypothetical protein